MVALSLRAARDEPEMPASQPVAVVPNPNQSSKRTRPPVDKDGASGCDSTGAQHERVISGSTIESYGPATPPDLPGFAGSTHKDSDSEPEPVDDGHDMSQTKSKEEDEIFHADDAD
jgi:hypothetical protein